MLLKIREIMPVGYLKNGFEKNSHYKIESLPLQPFRRDARVVEEARLESVYICQRVSRVRIPVSPQKNGSP